MLQLGAYYLLNWLGSSFSLFFYLDSNKTIVTIQINASEHTADNLADEENPIITPSTTVDVDCSITLNGKPTA